MGTKLFRHQKLHRGSLFHGFMYGRITWVLAFAVVAGILLVSTRAATPYVSLEAEGAGTKNGVTTVTTDSTASGSGYIQFKQVNSVPVGTTLPPGSVLPSEAQCSASVVHKAENRPGNATLNATAGQQKNLPAPYLSRVTGMYTGSTNDILQWVACKWGIDPNIVMAEAVTESTWDAKAKGDYGTDPTRCAPGHGLGVDGQAGKCPESYGIMQVRYPYHGPPNGLNTWPEAETSTAYNADYMYSTWRSCFEGNEGWLANYPANSGYAAGDAWGCVGVWYSGRWHTTDAEYYISVVKNNLALHNWDKPGF